MKLAVAIFWRCFLFTLLWAVLARGQFKEWPLLLVAVASATASSLGLVPPGKVTVRLAGLVRFVPYFLRESVLGGWDVARRVLSPALPLQPEVVVHTLRLRQEHSRVFFCWTISLLPGTACVGLTGARAQVHVLDASASPELKFRQLEKYLAAVFGEDLGAEESD